MYASRILALALTTVLSACATEKADPTAAPPDDTGYAETNRPPPDDTGDVDFAERGDDTIARDQRELEALTAELLGTLELGSEHVTITYIGKGRSMESSEDTEDIVEARELDTGRGEPMSAMVAFNPTTRNEFRIAISERALDASGRLANERGDDLGSGDRSVYEDPEDVESSVESPRYAWSDNVDNRIRFSQTAAENPATTGTTTWPWRTISRLSNGCSGTLVGPRHLVTAGHCIWSRTNNSWFTFNVTPGNAGNLQPYGTVAFPSSGFNWYFTPENWRAANPSGGATQYDFGILVLPQRIGEQTGWMGWWYAGESYLDTVSHYNRGFPSCNAFTANGTPRSDDPGDPGSSVVCVANHLYGDPSSCNLGEFTNDDGQGYYRVMKHSCDASGGQSGSPVYHYTSKGAPVVAGVHTFSSCGTTAMGTQCTAADDRPLGATHITKEYSDAIAFFREWAP